MKGAALCLNRVSEGICGSFECRLFFGSTVRDQPLAIRNAH